MSDNDETQVLAQLKGKLWYHLEMMLQDIESRDSNTAHVTHSKKYINAMVEVVLTKLQDMTADLEAFAKHDTGRQTREINTADLCLYLRNSPQLQQTITPNK
ncbi:similar to Saccharomyces cerevisiae YOL086W-A Putative protein of unknown function [Maudiozyma barnettii]|uniref:MHF histone-fold complex subunit 1 n=1 Tax=Maudiozyma barnettii TaxID=61262 RepID=A0A8H2VJP2_9SACH|nr:uncharacterized protein KABA2_10S03410 [Kazachstania barnettii]CAB4256621.1 similar to Saccharomyces cerevisiae YOL086W-A Putative protein of unknown function [Kazachstania barnettii]CAD1785224.1 similar to Saccharomyces cerevisiae YOL086W-A Putative protein of unknown function [Kazachstania barnettii]